MHVLLLGRYLPLLKALKQGLEEEDFTVDIAPDGQEGNGGTPAAGYDAIILDLVRPEDVGGLLVRGWHRAGLKTTVLALAPPGAGARVPGLRPLADDVLTKPFELEDLLARLRALPGSNAQGRDPIRWPPGAKRYVNLCLPARNAGEGHYLPR